jgi:hypothetical protein
MSRIVNTHAYLYQNEKFSHREEEILATLGTKLASAKTKEEVADTFKRVLSNVPAESIYKAAVAMVVLANVEPDAEKRAGFWDTAHGIAATLMAVPVLGSIVGQVARTGRSKGVLERVYREHPDLRGDPNVPRYAKIIRTFAPSVADDDLLLGNLLKTMKGMGSTSITPAVLKDILDFETSGRRTRGELAESVTGLGKALVAASPKKGRSGSKEPGSVGSHFGADRSPGAAYGSGSST